MYVEPSLDQVSFSCPHCGAFAHQKWAQVHMSLNNEDELPFLPTKDHCNKIIEDEEHSDEEKSFYKKVKADLVLNRVAKSPDRKDPYSYKIFNLHISTCVSCKNHALWLGTKLISPNKKQGENPSVDMPEEIMADYNEARDILPYSPRGSVALLRLCVQKLCNHLNAKGGNINDQISDLVSNGLSLTVKQSLDVLRVVGNNAVHPLEMDLKDDAKTATSLFKLVNIIVNEMITQPKEVQELYCSLPEGAKKAIDKRDTKIDNAKKNKDEAA